MAKATFDWQFHINNYVDHFADSMSLVEYALANDLNRNSARRSMGAAVAAALEAKGGAAKATAKGIKDATDTGVKMGKVVRREVRKMVAEKRDRKASKATGEASDQLIRSSGEGVSDQLITSSSEQLPDQVSKRPSAAKKQGAARPSEDKRDRSGRSTGEGADESAMVGEYLGDFEEQTPTRPKNRRGGARSNLHGRWATLTGIDQEILELAASPEYISNELTLTRARLADMYQTRGEALQKIRKDYNKGGPWLDDNGAAMPKEQALMQVVFGTSQPLTDLEKAIHRQTSTLIKLSLDRQRLELDRRKLELEERARNHLSHHERIELIQSIFDRRDAEGLTALDTARLFDRQGLPYPASLQAEVLREVTWIEPQGDNLGGITDEELDRLAKGYEEHQEHEMNVWLPARESAVTKFVAHEAALAAGEILGEEAFGQDELGEDGFGANGYRGEGAGPVVPDPAVVLADDDGSWDPEPYEDDMGEGGS